ncbi:MAG: hypothetical protein ACQEVT_07000 [Pseudomonadota bacterium]|uniref:hypothetical protein n=1 Tax=Roseovarius TaxID=74030 RepID=UPI0022A88261|nr:hypothetical protein [Roseovarius sp. EGI FJ00037]MCZ0812088.1 hypothetical protein [Roseovarius sp. EGI FJ00037]
MKITLHLGAHRTASSSLQHYMRHNVAALGEAGIGVWHPRRTRAGFLSGVIPVAGRRNARAQLDRARGRIMLNLQAAARSGCAALVVSDENMLGAARRNLREKSLYGDAGLRLARFAQAFDGRVDRVVLSVRAQDSYWSSALAFAVARGHRLPEGRDLEALARGARGWRDVIADVACAFGGAEILVLTHEALASRPEARLAVMAARPLEAMPRAHAREWLNRAPLLGALREAVAARGGAPARLGEGADSARWQPFDKVQTAALREAYADDLHWLRAGADGLATLIEETGPAKAEAHPPAGQMTRGHRNGTQERRMA